MFHSQRPGWIALLYKLGQANRDDDPHGVFVRPARVVGIFQGYRSAGDTGSDRRSRGLPLQWTAISAGGSVGGSCFLSKRGPSRAPFFAVTNYLARTGSRSSSCLASAA